MHDRLHETVPAELRERPQWVCWKYVDRAGKQTKCPVHPTFGWNASATDPETWTAFEQAVEAARANPRYAGVAFAFREDDPYCGIDLDDCIDEHGDLLWGNDLLVEFDTYTEVSPSGTGLKLFLRGTKPEHARCKAGGFGPDALGTVEVYDRGRVFAVTGDVWPGTTTSVEDRQDELEALCGRLWPRAEPPAIRVDPVRADREQRCLDAVLNMQVADRSDGSHRLYAACCRCVEHDLSDAEAVAVIREYGIRRPFPEPWPDAEVVKRIRDAERRCSRGSALPRDRGLSVPAPMKVGRLLDGWGELRRPVVHGLLREGETMNVIAATKFGKSWLVTDLALAIATGSHWLGTFEAEPGEVLVIDNELHRETSAFRIPKVVAARGYPPGVIRERMEIVHLRGFLRDIHAYGPWFRSLDAGRYKAIVIDAAYRFMPAGMDENDNGAMAAIYNEIDQHADRLECCFICIHHSSKGDQSGKSITDVGSGAGSQSRAVDTHLVFRPHEEDRCAVLDAAVRSWPPIAPRVLRWEFPVFNPDDSLDPADLKRPYRKKRRKEDAEEKPVKPTWTVEEFVEDFVLDDPKQTQFIVDAALDAGLSERRARALLKRARAEGLVHCWKSAPNEPWAWATEPQPLELDFTEAA